MENSLALPGYLAAQTGLGFFLQGTVKYLRISGPDQVAFIQRQSSNDVRKLGPGQAVMTVLTSPTARILDVLYLLQEADGAIGALTLPGRGEATLKFLKSRIFFMDKVTVEDVSPGYFQLDLLGPNSVAMLRKLGLETVPEIDQVAELSFGGQMVRVLPGRAGLGLGTRLLAPAQVNETLQAALMAQGAEPLAPETYDVLRVEAGLPGAAHELTESYTPLETGLAVAVSDTKGCYTGQEVLARQVNYDKVTQALCGLRLSAPAQVGDKVLVEGRPVGQVTSALVSPRYGSIALGVVRRPHFEAGTQIQVRGEQETQSAQVVELPFT